MTKLPDLKEQRGLKVAEMRGIIQTAETAGRDMTPEETTRFDALKTEAGALETRIVRAEAVAELERRADAAPVTGELSRETRAYSLSKALQESQAGRLTGREAEVHAELSRGRETRGVMVPVNVLLGETRAQTVGNDPSGGYLVGTQLAAMADRFRPALKTEAMGATILRGLTGFLDLPNLASSGSAAWVGEDQNATRTSASFEKISMGPRCVSAEYKVSRRLLLQTGQAIEEILRRDLGFLPAQALDLAAINGAGVLDPAGILQTAGVEKVTTETALGDTAANLIAGLELDDVSGSRAFLTNPTVAQVARKLKDGDGHFMPLTETFHGERVEITTQVPTNIGVGLNKSALIFGQWAELVIAYWSGVDILLNPYHSDVASSGGALIHAFLDCDVAVRHPKAFAYAEI